MDLRQLKAIVAYVSKSFSAAALMIWGVVNISLLSLQYVQRTEATGDWSVSILMCVIFGIVPLLLGSWLLYRNVVSTMMKPKK